MFSKLFTIFSRILPHNCILFESVPDCSDNTKAVFDEIIKREWSKHYSLIWVVNNSLVYKNKGNVKYVTRDKTILFHYYWAKSKIVISCNSAITSLGSFQKSVFLTHGVAIKACASKGLYVLPKNIDFVTGISDVANDINHKETLLPRNKFIVTGFPRNDDLLKDAREKVQNLFGNKYEKIIVWYPTFRQHKNPNSADMKSASLPIIHDKEKAFILNKYAQDRKTLIVLKPHFAQDCAYIKDLHLGNILFIDDEFFIHNNISSYEFVGGCDAMITDYSSIYFDYLLCNKPVAAIWEDIAEYQKSRGFAIDVNYYMKGAEKIYNLEDFLSFTSHVAEGDDVLCKERTEINNLINYYQDNNSSIRVVDFIESLL